MSKLKEDTVGPNDFIHLEDNLRIADEDEVRELGHTNIGDCLRQSVYASDFARVLRDDRGLPVCVYGVSSLPGFAAPWMLGTDAISMNRKDFLAHSKRVIGEWSNHYRVLMNIVDSRNEPALRWLRYLGFVINTDTPAHHGTTGVPFYSFRRLNVYG